MKRTILFIQGGGDDGYKPDIKMVNELRRLLGAAYHIHYPELRTNQEAADFDWPMQIGDQMAEYDNLLLVAHSLGASLALKFLSENNNRLSLSAVFLLAAPFWEGDESWKQALKLKEGFASNLPGNIPFFFYHCQDDKEVPCGQMKKYTEAFPAATFCELPSGGHQFEGRLDSIVQDIRLFR